MIERVPNGTHTIREVLPAGTICTSPEGCSYTRTFVQPGNSTGNDFGNYANLPPRADDDAAETDQGKAVEVDVLSNDSDPDGDPLTVNSYTQPGHGNVTCTADGRCTYTPDENFTGEDTFTYTVDDGKGGETTATVKITVKAVAPPALANQPPRADDDAAKTKEGKPVSVNVLSNDSDPDGDPLTVQSYTQPRHGKVTCTADGRCTYTPDKGYTGKDGLTYTVSDGKGGTRTAEVTVDVQPQRDPEPDPEPGSDPPAHGDDRSPTSEGRRATETARARRQRGALHPLPTRTPGPVRTAPRTLRRPPRATIRPTRPATMCRSPTRALRSYCYC